MDETLKALVENSQKKAQRSKIACIFVALAALLTAVVVALTSCLPLVTVSASGRPISTPWDAVLMQQLGQALLVSGGSYTPLPQPGNAKAPGEQQQQSQSQVIDCGQKDCPDPAKVVVPPDYYDK